MFARMALIKGSRNVGISASSIFGSALIKLGATFGVLQLLVAESTRFRILKLDLQALTKGSTNATLTAVTVS